MTRYSSLTKVQIANIASIILFSIALIFKNILWFRADKAFKYHKLSTGMVYVYKY